MSADDNGRPLEASPIDPRTEAVDRWLWAWENLLVLAPDDTPTGRRTPLHHRRWVVEAGEYESARRRVTVALRQHGSPFVYRGLTFDLDQDGNAYAMGGMPRRTTPPGRGQGRPKLEDSAAGRGLFEPGTATTTINPSILNP